MERKLYNKKVSRNSIAKNERGGMAALLSVIVFSTIIVMTLSSVYIYIENRAKFQGRVRSNYQMSSVMESMSKAVLKARQDFLSGGCALANVRYLDCVKVCMPNIQSLSGIAGAIPKGVTHAVCVKNEFVNKIVNKSNYFCAYNDQDGNWGASQPSFCSNQTPPVVIPPGGSVSQQDSFLNDPQFAMEEKLSHWFERLDRFFDVTLVQKVPIVSQSIYPFLDQEIQPPTLLGWLIPNRAYATTMTVGKEGYGYRGVGNEKSIDLGKESEQESPAGVINLEKPDQADPKAGGVTNPNPKEPPTHGDIPPSLTGNPYPTIGEKECRENPSLSQCGALCAHGQQGGKGAGGKILPDFCTNIDAQVNLGTVDCKTNPNNALCEKCGLTERTGAVGNTGVCMKVGICPPWKTPSECTASNVAHSVGDKRVFQTIKFN